MKWRDFAILIAVALVVIYFNNNCSVDQVRLGNPLDLLLHQKKQQEAAGSSTGGTPAPPKLDPPPPPDGDRTDTNEAIQGSPKEGRRKPAKKAESKRNVHGTRDGGDEDEATSTPRPTIVQKEDDNDIDAATPEANEGPRKPKPVPAPPQTDVRYYDGNMVQVDWRAVEEHARVGPPTSRPPQQTGTVTNKAKKKKVPSSTSSRDDGTNAATAPPPPRDMVTPTPGYNVPGCPDFVEKSVIDIKNKRMAGIQGRSKCPTRGKPPVLPVKHKATADGKASVKETVPAPSRSWLDHATKIFGEKVKFTALQWKVLEILHPLDTTTEDQDEVPIKVPEYDFSINWQKRFFGPRNEKQGSNSVKNATSKDGQACPFSEDEALMPMNEGRFALDGYSMVKFLWDWMFKKHGWITTPIAGTALGTYRHHGMYEHDDDMDMLVYPPLKYLLPPTLRERERWVSGPTRGGEALMEKSSYHARNPPLDPKATVLAPPTEAPKRKKGGARKGKESIPVLKRDYSWPMSNLDTWRWAYDDFHEQFLEYQQQFPDEDFQWEFTQTDFTYYARFENLHLGSRIQDYHDNIGPDIRSCGFRYDSTNRTDLRRMFWKGKPCLQNHFHLCLQPSAFLYETAPQGPASMFTLNQQRGMGNLCKCKFGPKESDSHYMLCSKDMLKFVDSWYSKWCVASGPTQHASQAVKSKSWQD